MIPIKAPQGYEALRFYDDGVREWRASARATGSTWWTNVGLAGHTDLSDEELTANAERLVFEAVNLGIVK